MYPVKAEHNALQDAWTWDAFLRYAELADKDGMTFGLGMGGGDNNTDATDTHGALFKAFGAVLVDNQGNILLKSEAIQQVLEYAQKLAEFYPADAVSYDDASNNRALISGKSALIFNPPSAWAVAKRDAPAVATDCWTFPAPTGPKGRFLPTLSFFWGVYNFSQNKSAAKDLIVYLMQRDQVEERCIASEGYSSFHRMPACSTSKFGSRSSRRLARSTTIRSGRGTTRNPVSPRPRRRRILCNRSIIAGYTIR